MGVSEASEFIRLVRDNSDISNNVGGCGAELIEEAERVLDVSFPPSYRRFLEELGDCDVAGEEFYGVFVRESDPQMMWGAVRETLQLRSDTGLPSSMIAFYADGMGGYYVFDTSQVDDFQGEAPIFVWEAGTSRVNEKLELIGADFGSVALRLARQAVERWRRETQP